MLFSLHFRSDLITVTGDKWIGLSRAFGSAVDVRQGSLPLPGEAAAEGSRGIAVMPSQSFSLGM